ncbi:MAG: hypothetical protein EON55_02525, partial [Alphaproteobacteria bacterium]
MANNDDIIAGSAALNPIPIGVSLPSDPPAEPASFTFDEESEREIAWTLKKYPDSRKASGVIPIL